MILATLANMRHHSDEFAVVAYSCETGEMYSANPSDYFTMKESEYLEDSEGHPMILARRVPEHYIPLEAA